MCNTRCNAKETFNNLFIQTNNPSGTDNNKVTLINLVAMAYSEFSVNIVQLVFNRNFNLSKNHASQVPLDDTTDDF